MAWIHGREDEGRLAMRAAGWASAGLTTVGAVALLGCGGLGDRADTGMCPTGERCSSATPNGLRFYGPLLAGTLDNAPHAVAVGGTQSLHFEDSRSATAELPPHSTVSSAPELVEVLASANREVVLRGVEAGEARIRVVEPAGALLDRVSVGAARIATVSVATPLFTRDDRPFAFAPGTQLVGVQLLGASGLRLVDEGLVFVNGSADFSIVEGSWDSVSIELLSGASATLELTAAGQSFSVTVPIAGTVDDIDVSPLPIGLENLDPLRVPDGGALCFDLLSGGATVVGSGATFAYRIDREISPTETGPCVALPTGLGASVLVEVTAAGITREFTAIVDHETGSMSLVDTSAAPLPQWGLLGERAFLVRGLDVPWLAPRGI